MQCFLKVRRDLFVVARQVYSLDDDHQRTQQIMQEAYEDMEDWRNEKRQPGGQPYQI